MQHNSDRTHRVQVLRQAAQGSADSVRVHRHRSRSEGDLVEVSQGHDVRPQLPKAAQGDGRGWHHSQTDQCCQRSEDTMRSYVTVSRTCFRVHALKKVKSRMLRLHITMLKRQLTEHCHRRSLRITRIEVI